MYISRPFLFPELQTKGLLSISVWTTKGISYKPAPSQSSPLQPATPSFWSLRPNLWGHSQPLFFSHFTSNLSVTPLAVPSKCIQILALLTTSLLPHATIISSQIVATTGLPISSLAPYSLFSSQQPEPSCKHPYQMVSFPCSKPSNHFPSHSK